MKFLNIPLYKKSNPKKQNKTKQNNKTTKQQNKIKENKMELIVTDSLYYYYNDTLNKLSLFLKYYSITKCELLIKQFSENVDKFQDTNNYVEVYKLHINRTFKYGKKLIRDKGKINLDHIYLYEYNLRLLQDELYFKQKEDLEKKKSEKINEIIESVINFLNL